MTGPEFVKWIEVRLIQLEIPKDVFYAESGIATANMSQWRTGKYNPSSRAIAKAKAFFEKCEKEKPLTDEGEELDYSDMELLAAIRKADAKDIKAIRVILGIE